MTQEEKTPNARRCFCPCHEQPGVYPGPWCGVCGHDNREGAFPGMLREGWQPRSWWQCPVCGEWNNNSEADHCLSCGESQPGHPKVSDERQRELRDAVRRRYEALRKAETLLGTADTTAATEPWGRVLEEWAGTLPDAEGDYVIDVYGALVAEEGIVSGL